ncbi:MAG: GEVED domain-containing protein [Spirosomataceae bacterium]
MILYVLRYFWLAVGLLTALLLPYEANAQTLPCGQPHEDIISINNRENRLLLLKQKFAETFQNANHTVQYLPIKAHILRRSDGTGGLSLADLNTALVQINRYYINVGGGIQFYLCGAPNYINNTTYFDFDNTEETALCNANDVSNAINLYFPNSIMFGSLAVSGYAYFPSTLSITNRLFVQASYATDTRTLMHEMGHYFNLLHTFQGSTDPNQTNRELVTRDVMQGANCATKGDLLCDTPADPYGRDSLSLLGCTYTGTARDPQGQLYNPSLSNVMSYYPISCGNIFTSGQYNRMNDGLLLRTDGANQYTLNCGPTVVGANVPSNLNGSVSPAGLNLTFTDNSSNETGFIIERSTTSTTEGFVPVGGVAPNITSFLDQTTTAFTTYYYRVKASNSSDQYSSVYTITTALNYCIPTYTNSCNSIAVVIDDFILKQGATTIINNINSNCSANNYGDFTSTAYNVTAGTTYTFTARALSGGGSGTYFDQHLTIWLDYDQDGLFEFSERVFRSDSASMPRMNHTATGSFTIPNNVSGIVRLRARSSFNSGSGSAVTDPCINLTYGETEDYSLNVGTVSPPSITTGTVSPNPVCAGQSISVSFTTTNLSSTSYVVQLSDAAGGNYANITTTGTSSPLTAVIPSGTPSGSGYKVRVNSVSPSVTGSESSTFTITSLPAAPTAPTPVNYCQNQTAVPLTATGSNLKWYTAASGGVGSTTAPTPATSSAGTVNYWVSQTVNTCESSRTQINVIVTATPVAPSVTSPVNYCQNQASSPLTATGSNLLWYTVASGGTGTGTAPTPSTITPGTTSYWVSQTVSGCESNRTQINVVVSTSPAAPTAITPVNYCQNQAASPLTATGSNLLWYMVAVGGTGSSTAPTPSTVTPGTTSYWVSQTVSGCGSSNRTQIDVIVTATPVAPTATTPINYCQNQSASPLTATGSNLKWYTVPSGGTGTGTAPTPSTATPGTANYWVSQTVSGCESNRTQINVVVTATPAAPTASTPINYLQNQTAVPLTATGTNLKWYTVPSGGVSNTTAPTPSTASLGSFNYYVSQTVNNCESARTTIVVNVTTASSVTACPVIKVYLEGNWNGTEMTTKLNQQGLLPGQTPISPFGIPTPAGQPYKTTPWNYQGNETVNTYNSDVVDWVLISLRTNVTDVNSVVYKSAALLLKTGAVTLQSACPLLNPSQSYSVVIEHRNHVGAASHQPVSIVNNAITYDFTLQQSYIPSNAPSSGQQKVGSVYCLLAGDCNKASFSEINANDGSVWRLDNGKFARYQLSDFNLDGEINANDETIWRRNNGKFSGVNF